MTSIPFDIVGFDLDGTLIDTSGDLTAAVNHALALAGRPPFAIAAVTPMIGGGAKHMLRLGLEASGGITDEAFRPLYKAMLAYYADNISVHSRPFPGAEAALDALATAGTKLAIVTNKFEAMARQLINDLGLADRFVTIIGGDTMGPGRAKPDAAPINEMIARCGGGRAVFVGDSAFDAGAARNAGVPFIAAGYGFLDGPVEALSADAVIDHFDDLLPLLTNWRG